MKQFLRPAAAMMILAMLLSFPKPASAAADLGLTAGEAFALIERHIETENPQSPSGEGFVLGPPRTYRIDGNTNGVVGYLNESMLISGVADSITGRLRKITFAIDIPHNTDGDESYNRGYYVGYIAAVFAMGLSDEPGQAQIVADAYNHLDENGDTMEASSTKQFPTLQGTFGYSRVFQGIRLYATFTPKER